MSNMPGRHAWDWTCSCCNSKRLRRLIVKRLKAREKRAWRKDQGL